MKSREHLEKLWTQALSDGVCPFKGCDIKTKTCWHLDQYLKVDGNTRVGPNGHVIKRGRDGEPSIYPFEHVEEMKVKTEKVVKGQVWDLFKKLRHFGIPNHQIGILVRRFGYGMSFGEIQKEMGWTTYHGMYSHYRNAMNKIKKEGGL